MKRTYITILCIEDPGPLVTEYLRYMGVVRVTSLDSPSPIPMNVSNTIQPRRASDVLVTIQCPYRTTIEQSGWANGNMNRLSSFAAPAVWWTDTDSKGAEIQQHTHAFGVLLANRRRGDVITTELDKGNVEPLVDALTDNFYSSGVREVKQ